jgi:hypothetical protein
LRDRGESAEEEVTAVCFVSYESQNTLPKETRLETVCEFLQLLGYQRVKGRHPLRQPNVIDFGWFHEVAHHIDRERLADKKAKESFAHAFVQQQ